MSVQLISTVLLVDGSTSPEEFRFAVRNHAPQAVQVQGTLRADVRALLDLARRRGVPVSGLVSGPS